MNRIARTAANLTIATGLAAAALTLSSTAAHAEGPGNPGQIALAPHTDPSGPQIANPTPTPDPLPVPPKPKNPEDPKPQFDGPGDIAIPPHCTHGCGGSEVPDDKAGPVDEPTDEPTEDPAHDAPLDQGCFTGCDLPEDDDVSVPSSEELVIPNRVDAGVDAAQDNTVSAAPSSSEVGLGYYVGLGLFSIAGAFGIALAARRLKERKAAQA